MSESVGLNTYLPVRVWVALYYLHGLDIAPLHNRIRALGESHPSLDAPCAELCGQSLRDVLATVGGPTDRSAPAGSSRLRRARRVAPVRAATAAVCVTGWWERLPDGGAGVDDDAHRIAVAACRVWIGVARGDAGEVRAAVAAMEGAAGGAAVARGVVDGMGVLAHAVAGGSTVDVVAAVAEATTAAAEWTATARRVGCVLGRWGLIDAIDACHGVASVGTAAAGPATGAAGDAGAGGAAGSAAGSAGAGRAAAAALGATDAHWAAAGGRMRWDEWRGGGRGGDVGAVDASGDTVVHSAIVGASAAARGGGGAGAAGSAVARRSGRRACGVAAAVEAVRAAARAAGAADAAAFAARPAAKRGVSVCPVEWWYGGTLFRRNARWWTAAHEAAGMGDGGGPGGVRAATIGAVLREATRSYERNVGACVQREHRDAAVVDFARGTVPPDWRVDTHAVETDGAARLLEVTDVVGQTALHVAARHGHADAVRVVVDTLVDAGYGDVVLWEDDAQCDALLYAATNGDAAAVEKIRAALVVEMATLCSESHDSDVRFSRLRGAAKRALEAAVAAGHGGVAYTMLDLVRLHTNADLTPIRLPLTANNSRLVADIVRQFGGDPQGNQFSLEKRNLFHVYLGPFTAWPGVGAPTGDGVSAEERRLWPKECRIGWAIASDDAGSFGNTEDDAARHLHVATYHRPQTARLLGAHRGCLIPGHVQDHNGSPTPWLRGLPPSHRLVPISAADAAVAGLVALPQRRVVDSAARDATWRGVLDVIERSHLSWDHLITVTRDALDITERSDSAWRILVAAADDGARVGPMYTTFCQTYTARVAPSRRAELAARLGLGSECDALLSGATATDHAEVLRAALRGAAEGGHNGHAARLLARGAVVDTVCMTAIARSGNLAMCRALVEGGGLDGGRVDRRALVAAAVPHPEVLEYLCDAMAATPSTPTPKPCLGKREACDLRLGYCSTHNLVRGTVSLATFLVLRRWGLVSTDAETTGDLMNPHASLRAVCADRDAFDTWLRACPDEQEGDVWMRVRVAAGLIPRIHVDSVRWWYENRYHLVHYVMKHSTPAARSADLVSCLKAADRRIEIVSVEEIICCYKLDLAATDGEGSLLHLAARSDPTLVRVLCQLAASGELAAAVDARDAEGNTPLYRARSEFAVTALVAAGANVNVRNLRGQTPIMAAAPRVDNGHIVRGILGAAAAILSARASGFGALLQQLSAPHPGLDDTLVTLGAVLDGMPRDASAGVVDVDARDGDGWTAVLHAVSDQRLTTLPVLLDAGASVSLGDARGLRVTPLVYAVRGADLQLARRILALGADANETNASGRTALHQWAAWTDSTEKALSVLLDGGANINARDDVGDTPLCIAACVLGGGCYDRLSAMTLARLIRALIAAGGDPNARSNSGETILIKAIRSFCYPNALAVLEAGADVHLQADDGTTALSALEEVMRARPFEQAAQQVLDEALVLRGARQSDA